MEPLHHGGGRLVNDRDFFWVVISLTFTFSFRILHWVYVVYPVKISAMKRFMMGTCLVFLQVSLIQAQTGVGPAPVVKNAVYFDVSPPLRDMVVVQPVPDKVLLKEVPNKTGMKEVMNLTQNPFALPEDPVWQKSDGPLVPMWPVLMLNFEGMNNLMGYYPPDPQGDVGPNHYLQVVNSDFAVYSKTGTTLFGPAALHTIWNGIPSPWNGTDDGDPIIVYDQAADRWIISQFSLPTGNYAELVAVSQTSDPTGAWYRYIYTFGNEMPDYPKFGVWPDGYYLSVNLFTGAQYWSGVGVAALERSKMLQGDPSARIIYFALSTSYNVFGMLPSDWDGTVAPLANEPNYFTYFDDWSSATQDFLKIYEFHADWINTANSTLNLATTLVTAPFKSNICSATRDRCIPQPGTAIQLESLADRLMYRLQYRNFGTHRSMVTNHTVDVTGSGLAGIRWYELRNTGAGWSIYQQGTWSPDANHRWVGSIAMNAGGEIALGYSVSNGTNLYPGIRFTGRRPGDPLGQMTLAEQTLINGSGSQTGTACRWGDYSMMSVDPTNEKTFWYTTEYIQTTGTASWQTRIGAFQITNDPTVQTLPATGIINTAATLNGTINPNGLSTTYYFEYGTTTSYGNTTPLLVAGSGTTPVTVNAAKTGLTPGTLYHNRLVGINSQGTVYGIDNTFLPGAAVVTTNPVTAITINTATCGGNVVTEGAAPVTARGVCWSTGHDPLITGAHTNDGTGAGAFTSSLTGLSQNTTYSVRAYATSSIGTFYGQENTFTTPCGVYSVPFSETFDNTTIPGCWSQVDHQGNGQIWAFGVLTDQSPNPALTGNYAYLNSDGYGSGNSQNADLITPPLDLTGYTTVILQFKHYFLSYTGSSGKVYYSIDNGTTWTLIQTFTNTSLTNPELFSVSISAVGGHALVRFKWNYTGSWGYYWAIDDVVVKGPLYVTPPNRSLGPMAAGTTFTVDSFYPWNATSNQPWCQVAPAGAGPGSMTVTVAANPNPAPRTAQITVSVPSVLPVVVTVQQAGLFPPTNLGGTPSGNNVLLSWNKPGPLGNIPVPVSSGPFIPEPQPAAEITTGAEQPAHTDPLPALLKATSTSGIILFDNGPIVNSPGTGAGGADESILYTPLTLYGLGAQQTAANSLAEDFTVPAGTGWDPKKFIFYCYQTNSTTASTITGLYFRIYNGDPTTGGTVIWGDLTTNRLTATSWASIYRTNTVNGGTARPIMTVEGTCSGLHLNSGTYWVEFQFTGASGLTGPWVPPITITGTLATGNALQYTSEAWISVLDGSYAQGIPFAIEDELYGLIGYNIYRNGTFIHYNNQPDALTYNDTGLPSGTYDYTVKAWYDLTLYGFPGQFGESLPAGPKTVVINVDPENLVLTDITITDPDTCFYATQTITVAGNGSTFLVQAGGGVTLVAGSKINLLPGVRVFPQGYLHAYISGQGNPCNQQSAPGNPALTINGSADGLSAGWFQVYPNPTSGKFTLQLTDPGMVSYARVRIYNMLGTEVLRREMRQTDKLVLSLDDFPPGIYIINIENGEKMESVKLIRQ